VTSRSKIEKWRRIYISLVPPQNGCSSTLRTSSFAAMVRLSALTASLASLPLIFAHPAAEIFSRQERNGCGTEAPPAEFLEAVAAFDVGDAKLPEESAFRTAAYGGDPFENPIVIKTWLHVVAGAETLSEGWIPDSQLKAQMDVLNEAFGM
jgi:hypothetical protein